MKRTDRFVPVVTAVIYYGEKPWDGAVSLHEILDIPEEMKPYVNDYKIILVEAGRNDLIFHNVNNRDLFYLFKLMMDKNIPQEEKKKRFQEYRDDYQTNREVLITLAGIMHMKLDDSVFEKEDKSVSCTFLEEIKAEGRAEGIIETGMEYGVSDEDILNRLQRKLDISLQKAQEYLEMFGKQAV